MNKKEQAKKAKIQQVKRATQKRVKRFEEATGVKLNIDYSLLEKSPGRYAKQYEQISLRNFKSKKSGKLNSKIITSIEGTDVSWYKFKPTRKQITLEGEQAIHNLKLITDELYIKQISRHFDIAPDKERQTKFKTRKQYKNYLIIKNKNAYDNLHDSLKAAMESKSVSEEDKKKLEKMYEIVDKEGLNIVKRLNNTGLMYKKVFSFFDSDQEGQVSLSNVDNLEEIFKKAGYTIDVENTEEKNNERKETD